MYQEPIRRYERVYERTARGNKPNQANVRGTGNVQPTLLTRAKNQDIIYYPSLFDGGTIAAQAYLRRCGVLHGKKATNLFFHSTDEFFQR